MREREESKKKEKVSQRKKKERLGNPSRTQAEVFDSWDTGGCE